MISRRLSVDEKGLLQRLLAMRSEEYQELEDLHLDQSLVTEIDSYGSLKFIGREQGGIQVKLPVEAQFQDQDGMWVHAILFKKGTAIDELEIYKDDGSPMQRRPSQGEWDILIIK